MIAVGSHFSIESSHFTSNVATSFGGAIYATSSSSFEINKTVFGGNSASNTGGVLYLSGVTSESSSVVNNCEFFNNSASTAGVIYSTNSQFTIQDNVFTTNDAGDTGGVFSLVGESVVSSIGNLFINNFADTGGIGYVEESNFSCIECNMTGNIAESRSSGIELDSGNITLESSNIERNIVWDGRSFIWMFTNGVLNINNCNFNHNNASQGGTIVGTRGSAIVEINLYNSNFTNQFGAAAGNSAYGGIFYLASRDSIFIGANCYFENNIMWNPGAILYLQGGAGSIVEWENMTFVDNSADLFGGIAFIAGGIYSCNDCIYENNDVTFTDTPSGGLYYIDGSTVTLNNINVSNQNFYQGSVIYSVYSNITINNANFDNNVASLSGGVIYASTSMIQISDSQMTNCGATESGGCIYGTLGSEIIINNGYFSDNTAFSGGSVFMNSTASTLTVTNTTFMGDTATWGGNVYLSRATATFNKCNFNSSQASFFAGSMYVASNAYFEANECNFIDNSAVFGGAVLTVGSRYKLSNCQFLNNDASSYGGAVYSTGVGSFEISKCIFDSNIAGNDGGGLHLTTQEAPSSITNSEFKNHYAESGATIFSDESIFTIENSIFTNGNATLDAGVLYLSLNSLVEARNSSFIANTADTGGIGYVEQSNFSCFDCNMTDNTALSRSSGIEFDSGEVTLDSTTVERNIVWDGRSFIWIFTDGTLNIDNCNFENNNASQGGTIIGTRGNAIVEINLYNSTFIGQFAAGSGSSAFGGIFYLASRDSLFNGANCYFANNVIWNPGAIIFATGGDGNVIEWENMTFVDNSADLFGGIGYLIAGDYTCDNCTYENNDVTFTDEPLGGIYAVSGTSIALDNMVVIGNDFYQGSVIYAFNSRVNITNGYFESNTADENGGVIYAIFSDINLKNVEMYSCVAVEGGCIYGTLGTRITIDNSTFMDNTAACMYF